MLLACMLWVMAPAVMAAERMALVIGNNKYAYAPLDNAINDARGLRERLKQLGFDVVYREDATRREMNEALREFSGKLRNAEVALVFFAGHGMQYRGQNYLIPTDASLVDEADIESEGFGVNLLLTRLAQGGAGHSFLFLDACRNNPLGSRVRISQQGLASIESELPRNSRLMYATAPGQVAYDSLVSGQRNGAFTAGILKWLGVADLESAVMVQRIATTVFESTQTLKPPQNPYVNANAVREFYFGPRTSGAAAAVASAPDNSTVAREAAVTTQDTEFWKEVRDSGFRAELLRAYLRRFPAGGFSDIARLRLKEIDDAVLASPATAATGAAKPAAPVATPPLAVVAPSTPSQMTIVAPTPQPLPPAATASVAAPAAPSPAIAVAAPAATAPAATVRPPEERYDEIDNKDFTYKGKVRGTRLHGSGEFFSKTDRFKYVGDFVDGQKHGKGEFEWPNGDRYAGPFVNDRPLGEGVFRFANGNVFIGEVNGEKLVRGKMQFKSGDTFVGGFDGTQPHGEGTYSFVNGDVYEGPIVTGKIEGANGRYRSANGDTYTGSHVAGLREGRGKIVFQVSGHEYEGDFRSGRLTGTGTYRFGSTGMVYTGEVTDGSPNGKGVLRFADGATIEGVFRMGTRNLTGTLIDKDGKSRRVTVVDGEYKNE
jgi:hypothetical protein